MDSIRSGFSGRRSEKDPAPYGPGLAQERTWEKARLVSGEDAEMTTTESPVQAEERRDFIRDIIASDLAFPANTKRSH